MIVLAYEGNIYNIDIAKFGEQTLSRVIADLKKNKSLPDNVYDTFVIEFYPVILQFPRQSLELIQKNLSGLITLLKHLWMLLVANTHSLY